MRKKPSQRLLRYVSTFVFITAIGALIVTALYANIQSLNDQVGSLEGKVSAAEKQLATYERTMCNKAYAIGDVDMVTKYTIQSAGYTRTYQVHTPSNYDPSIRYPVILSFDGIDGSGAQMEAYSGLDALPAIIVYPDSLMSKQNFTAWQGAPYSLDGDHDIAFVKTILETLPEQYCTDVEKTFAVGMSNGGSFATIVGCKLGGQIRAVASISGAYYSSCKSEQRTPSLLAVHSTDDNRVYFNGDVKRGLPLVPTWVQGQVEERDCKTAEPVTQDATVTNYTWTQCADASKVQFVVLHGQMHGWVNTPQIAGKPIQTTAQYIWNFFEQLSHAQ